MIHDPEGNYCFADDCEAPVNGMHTFCRDHFDLLPRTFQRALLANTRALQDYRKRFDKEFLIALRDSRNFLVLRDEHDALKLEGFTPNKMLAWEILAKCGFCKPMTSAMCDVCGKRGESIPKEVTVEEDFSKRESEHE